MSAPTITVLMSVHNGESYVQKAIDSILAQTHRDLEFLVIDDASTDRTGEILRGISDKRLRVTRMETNIGLTACLNRGLELANGTLIARQDADDVSYSRRLELQRGFLERNGNVVAVGSQARAVDGAGRSLGIKRLPLTHHGIEWMAVFDNPLVHSAVMFRRDPVREAGGYDPQYAVSQDYELWTRLAEGRRLANMSETLVTLTSLEGSVTHTHRRPELIRSVQQRQATRLFPDRSLTTEEFDLIGKLRSRIEPDEIGRFRAIFRSLLAEYRTRPANREEERDLRRTVALQRERVGYNLLTSSRVEGLREIAGAVTESPGAALRVPWLRVAALAILGDSARRMYEKFA